MISDSVLVGLLSAENKEMTLRTLLAKEIVDKDLDMKELAMLTEGYTGSDLKENSLNLKVMNEIAKAIITKNGVSLSICGHDETVRRIKCEAAQAHKQILGSMSMVPKRL